MIHVQELLSITLAASVTLEDVLTSVEQYKIVDFTPEEIYKAFDRVCKELLRKEGNPKLDYTSTVVPAIKRIVDINFKRCMNVPEAQD